MKSRVDKNRDLYASITNESNEEVVSSDLSHYANQLNTIDNSFERMNIMDHDLHDPIHAKDVGDVPTGNLYDTFENEYLKDFLDEVKEYNVRKGYRSKADTQANIFSAFSDSDILSKEDDDSYDSLVSLVHSIDANRHVVSSIQDFDETEISEAVESASVEEPLSIESLFASESVISDAVSETPQIEDTIEYVQTPRDILNEQGFDPDAAWNTSRIPSQKTEPVEYVEPAINAASNASKDSVVTSSDGIDADQDLSRSSDLYAFSDVTFEPSNNYVTLEETKTIQLKLEEHQKDLEQITESVVHANRILNTVIALVLLALVVVIAVIVKLSMK